MIRIAILDTSVCTKNLGDQIIMDAVTSELRQIFPGSFFFHLATHDYLGTESYKLLDQADLAIIGGTNLLSSNMDAYNQWKIGWRDYFKLRDVVLMGVGWWQYQPSPNTYTRRLFRKVLSSSLMHSVRDRYTLFKMQEMGFRNVVNTSCPTTWRLTEEFCASIPESKADQVVMTITDYNRDPQKDRYLWEILRRAYDKVYLWVQGSNDLDYARSLFGDSVEYLSPTVAAFDDLLRAEEPIDYVGTRLHAGIRALNHGRRSIIIGIDNRAAEIAKDLNLIAVERSRLPDLKALIGKRQPTRICLPLEQIARWKAAVFEAVPGR